MADVNQLMAVSEAFLEPLGSQTFLSSNDVWTLVANYANIVDMHTNYLTKWHDKVDQARQLKLSIG